MQASWLGPLKETNEKYKCAPLAQSVEHRAYVVMVEGSIPSWSISFLYFQISIISIHFSFRE